MTLPYSEGAWFTVPLERSGFAVGLVARATVKGKVILCYFFGPRRQSIPTETELQGLQPSDAMCVLRIGDLSLITGEWPVIFHSVKWERPKWKMPPFIRRDDLGRKAWKVQYSDNDPNKIDREEPLPYEAASDLKREAVLGASAVGRVLASLLK